MLQYTFYWGSISDESVNVSMFRSILPLYSDLYLYAKILPPTKICFNCPCFFPILPLVASVLLLRACFYWILWCFPYFASLYTTVCFGLFFYFASLCTTKVIKTSILPLYLLHSTTHSSSIQVEAKGKSSSNLITISILF